jgi:hypothetical protein
MVGIILEAMAVGPQDLLALGNDDDVATGDALCSGCPVWHAPGELARDSGSMSSGTSLLLGSHLGRNRFGGNGGGSRRFALRDDDDDNATCGVVFQNDLTLILLVLQQNDCSFSYCAFPMHDIGISVLLIMNWWG